MRSTELSSAQFLRLAILFEGGLGLVGLLIANFTEVELATLMHIHARALLWGCAGTVPLLCFFSVAHRLPSTALQGIRELLVTTLGRQLAGLGGMELLLVAAAAGFGEELLFRGAIQISLEQHSNAVFALLASNVLFALAHAITPLYALLAGLTGIYLGLAMDLSGERNLLIPILIHGLYDFLAFIAVARLYRLRMPANDAGTFIP